MKSASDCPSAHDSPASQYVLSERKRSRRSITGSTDTGTYMSTCQYTRELGPGVLVDNTTCISGRTLIGATSAIGTGPSCNENEANATALPRSSITLSGARPG